MNKIIEEVRAARESLAARYDYDVEKLAAALAERSKAAGRGIASPALVAIAEREREVEGVALLASSAHLDETAFIAAYREGTLTTAQWAVMALRVGAGQTSPEVAALVEREATHAAQWAFLLR